MSGTVAAGIAGAVLLFWVVGAYNRIVRLRSQALQAFGALAVQLRRRHALAESAPPIAPDPSQRFPTAPTAPIGLHAAAQQFGASITAAQTRPLAKRAMISLGAANALLSMAWQRHALDGASVAEPLLAEWQAVSIQLAHAGAEFDATVTRYNEALREFPTRIIAALFGLRPAGKFEP